MPTSQEVFALRRAGYLDEAYVMASELIDAQPNDEYIVSSFVITANDKIKYAVELGNFELARQIAGKLENVEINEWETVLLNTKRKALLIADPEKKIIIQAREASITGMHAEAIMLFRQAIKKFPNDIDVNTQFAWELQKEGKLIFETLEVDVLKARRLLAEYIGLKNDRPSKLHSYFLGFADKIYDREDFKFISFLKLWDLKNLRNDDFETYKKNDKEHPGIAEKVIHHGAKVIFNKKHYQEVDFFMPFLDKGITRFANNLWLPYYKAKLLHLVHRNEEAIEFLVSVIKEKISEYWTWSLLAELVIENDKEKAISCYCKSLLCKGEDKFIAKVRTKFAELLIQKELWSEAKFEIAAAIKAKEDEGATVSDTLRDYQQKNWYKNAPDKKSNNDYYNSHKQLAEELIFHSLPWLDGCLGEAFTIPDKPDKPRRKLYIKLNHEIIEVVISDRRFYTSRNYRAGDSIRIKGEYDKENAFKVYLLEKRHSDLKWDLFEEQVGIVDHINHERGIAHIIISKQVDIVLKLNQCQEKIDLGTKLSVRLKKAKKDREYYYSALTCQVTNKEPSEALVKQFIGFVEKAGSFGFANDVYLDKFIMLKYKVEDGNFVSGTAIINYDKSKSSWGWKALNISTVEVSELDDISDNEDED